MRVQLTQATLVAPLGGQYQLVPAGTVFGDGPGDAPLPPAWGGQPPYYCLGLDSAGIAAVAAAQAAIIAANYPSGTIPGFRV
jgi:hypothetical protein